MHCQLLVINQNILFDQKIRKRNRAFLADLFEGFFEFGCFVGSFPRQVDVVSAKVPKHCSFAVDGF
jgi:hypothetical protein